MITMSKLANVKALSCARGKARLCIHENGCVDESFEKIE